MRMLTKILIASLLCAAPASAANVFTGDANCVSLFKFDDGAIDTETIGTNGFVENGGTIDANTADYQEGDASADFEAADTEWLTANNASLDTGYPFKSGDPNKRISLCVWIKLESDTGATQAIHAIMQSGKLSWRCGVHSSDTDDVGIWLGYNSGDSWETITHGTACSTGVWYHVGVTYQDSDKAYKLRVWDANAVALLGGSEVTGTATNNINIEDGVATIGMGRWILDEYHFDGLMDELVIFNDILTSDEIDEIRSGTYGAVGTSQFIGVTFVKAVDEFLRDFKAGNWSLEDKLCFDRPG